MSLSNVYSTYEINKLAAALAGKFPGGGSVTEVTGLPPINVDNNTTTPEISLKLGLFLDVDGNGDLDLKVSNAPVAGKILSAVDTSGEMQWTNAGTGTLTEITSGDGVIGIADPNGPVPSLTVNVGTFLQKTGGNLDLNVAKPTVPDQVLSSDTTGALSWVAQTGGGGGGTVTSVTATTKQYCKIDGTPTNAPTVGLNIVGAAGNNGQVLSATANLGELAFTNAGTGTVTLVKSDNPFIQIDNPSLVPKITINTGTYVKNTTANLLDLNVGVPLNDNDILSSTIAGALTWVTPAAGTIYTPQPPIAISGSVISLPINGIWSPTNNVVKSTNEDTLQWGSDTAGSGTVTNVTAAFPLTVATGTSSSTPAISLNLSNSFESDTSNKLALKTTIAPVDGYILSAVGTEGILNWIAPPAAGVGTVTNVTTTNPFIAIATPTATPDITLNTGTYVKNVVNGANNNLDLNVPVPAADDYILSSKTNGALSWIAPPSSGVTSITAGNGIVVDTTTSPNTPAVPLIHTAIVSASFLTNTAGGSSNQLDLKAPECPTSGFVLSSTVGGGGSGTDPVLSWVPQTVIPTPLTFDAPLNLNESKVTLPISGTWTSGTNDVVIGSSATSLAWGSGVTAGVASITAGSGISVTGTSSVPIVNAVIRASSFLQLTQSTNVLDLNAPDCPTSGYVLSSTVGGGTTGTAPVMSWVPNATGVYSVPTQTYTVSPAGFTASNVNPMNLITMANVFMLIPPSGGIVITAPIGGVPKGTVISLTISGLPTAGPLAVANGTISFSSDMLDITTPTDVISTPGEWNFDPSANTFTFESTENIVVLGLTLQVFPPMLIYTSN